MGLVYKTSFSGLCNLYKTSLISLTLQLHLANRMWQRLFHVARNIVWLCIINSPYYIIYTLYYTYSLACMMLGLHSNKSLFPQMLVTGELSLQNI